MYREFPIYYGWVVLAVAGLGLYISGPGQTYSVSLFVDPIIEDTGWSRTLVSGLYSAGSFTAAAGMLLVGRMLDRFGARVMFTVIGVLFGFAALLMSLVNSPFLLYLGFASIRMLGQGSLTLISTTLVAIWFVRNRGRAISLCSLGSVASQASLPLLIHFLITRLEWRGAWVVLAFLIWGVLLPPALLLVRRSPEHIGLLPDGDTATTHAEGEKAGAITTTDEGWSLKDALKTRAFWLLLLTASSNSLIGTALIFHQVSLFGTHGLDAGVAASVFIIMAPLALVGIFTAGFLSDRFPNRYLLIVGQLILSLAMLVTLVMVTVPLAFIYGALLGFSNGFLMTISAVIWPNYFGRASIGSIRGAAVTSMVAFSALGPLPFGFLFDLTSSYTLAVLLFLALPALCIVAAYMARPPRKALLTAPGEILGSGKVAEYAG
ncbi:MAG: MFS transporter [Chloroflexi bacterium]|nr:MFS transporter [Chloroflexota bacterium]